MPENVVGVLNKSDNMRDVVKYIICKKQYQPLGSKRVLPSKIYLLLVTKALLSKVILIELNKYGLQLVGWLGVGLAHW